MSKNLQADPYIQEMIYDMKVCQVPYAFCLAGY